MKVAPTKADVDAATTTENCATLGLFAPSSFDTLTLMQMHGQNCAEMKSLEFNYHDDTTSIYIGLN